MSDSTRRLLHTRHITCRGYTRSDGRFDIEAHLQDIKADDADVLGKRIPAGEAFHDLHLTLVIDETALIDSAHATTVSGPTSHCAEINAAYASLAGLRIGPGFTKAARQRVGGKHGCTHLTELLAQLATTALQTVRGARRLTGQDTAGDQAPQMIDTCHAWRADGEVVRFLRQRALEQGEIAALR